VAAAPCSPLRASEPLATQLVFRYPATRRMGRDGHARNGGGYFRAAVAYDAGHGVLTRKRFA